MRRFLIGLALVLSLTGAATPTPTSSQPAHTSRGARGIGLALGLTGGIALGMGGSLLMMRFRKRP